MAVFIKFHSPALAGFAACHSSEKNGNKAHCKHLSTWAHPGQRFLHKAHCEIGSRCTSTVWLALYFSTKVLPIIFPRAQFLLLKKKSTIGDESWWWSGSARGSGCGLWGFPLLELRCFQALAFWALFGFSNALLRFTLQLSFIFWSLTYEFLYLFVFILSWSYFGFFCFDLPWMEYNQNYVRSWFIEDLKLNQQKKKTIVIKAMIPCKLVHSGINMFDGAMLPSWQDCMSASVNRSLTIILVPCLICWLFFLFIYYCSFNPCAAACDPYRLVLVQCSESDCQTCCNWWKPQRRCFSGLV